MKPAGGRIEAHSAGSRPWPLHPCAVRVMAGRGISLAGHRPKHLDEFAGQHFDYVITVCDKVREICPEFPGQPETVHWSVPDPAAASDAAAPAARRSSARPPTSTPASSSCHRPAAGPVCAG